MTATRLAFLGALLSLACSGSSPATPSPNPPAAATFVISGTVYQIDAAGRRPLIAAMVELADPRPGSGASTGGP